MPHRHCSECLFYCLCARHSVCKDFYPVSEDVVDEYCDLLIDARRYCFEIEFNDYLNKFYDEIDAE